MNTDPSSPAGPFVGIDVAQDKLDLACSHSDKLSSFSNDRDGIGRIVELMLAAQPQIIVVEATGGLERGLVETLLDADLPVALVHPARVRHFAKALGVIGKTDRLDANVLVNFGRLASPRLSEKRSKNELELRDLVACRRQLAVTRAQQFNRCKSTFSKPALRCIQAVLKTLDRQIDTLDQRIRKLIDADDDFRHLDGLLQSVPGVGPTLSATLAAELHELGEADRRQLSALVGVAPFNHDSGKRNGQRSIRGGRLTVRCVLYMATVTAIRCNPVIQAFAHRLSNAGKRTKVVIVACMRKLLSLINAMIRDGLQWHELEVVKALTVIH